MCTWRFVRKNQHSNQSFPGWREITPGWWELISAGKTHPGFYTVLEELMEPNKTWGFKDKPTINFS